VILTVRAKASVTAGFMRAPPYFQNIQTSDVVASQLQRTALSTGHASAWDDVPAWSTAGDVRLDGSSLKLT